MILSAVLLLSQLIAQSSTQNSTLKEAHLAFDLKNYDQAAMSFEQLAVNDPQNEQIQASLALCYKRSGQLEKARKSYLDLCQRNELNPEVYFEFADLLKSNHEFAEAKKYYLLYAKSNPVIGSYFATICDEQAAAVKSVSQSDEPATKNSVQELPGLPLQVQEPPSASENQAREFAVKGSSIPQFHKSESNSTEEHANVSSKPTHANANADQKPSQAIKQYFIQLTALTKYSSKMDERFSKFATYGDIYKVNVDGTMKIRIGAFNDINEAVAVLKLVKKNDFKDAFIVTDVLDQDRTVLIARSTSSVNAPKELPKAETAPTENPKVENQAPASTPTDVGEEGKYKIRVSEYKAPDWFDVSKINDLGNIEHWTKSGLTIIVLGSYKTEESAKMVLKKLKSRGFKDAYLVVEDNGKLYRL